MNELERRCNLLWDMQDLFYQQEKCSCGGPLHILLDDGNVEDCDIVFCYVRLHEEKHANVRSLGLAILHELMFLNPAQRRLWLEHNTIENIDKAITAKLIIGKNGQEIIFS